MELEKKIEELEKTIEIMKAQLNATTQQVQDLEVNVYHLLKGIVDEVEEKAGVSEKIAPTIEKK